MIEAVGSYCQIITTFSSQDKLAQRGIEVTAEHKQQFLKIKEAYDVLSDPKKRKLYDQLGVTGMKLMENPTEVDPMLILKNYQVRFPCCLH